MRCTALFSGKLYFYRQLVFVFDGVSSAGTAGVGSLLERSGRTLDNVQGMERCERKDSIKKSIPAFLGRDTFNVF